MTKCRPLFLFLLELADPLLLTSTSLCNLFSISSNNQQTLYHFTFPNASKPNHSILFGTTQARF